MNEWSYLLTERKRLTLLAVCSCFTQSLCNK